MKLNFFRSRAIWVALVALLISGCSENHKVAKIVAAVSGDGHVVVPISGLDTKGKENLVFKTRAFVVFVYRCPLCPEGALCKPCMRDNVVISESPEPRTNYNNMGTKDLILYTTREAPDLEIAKKYEFEIRLQERGESLSWSGNFISVRSLN